MSFAWVASILRMYPVQERPELFKVEAYSGILLASNSHVILMSPTSLPNGQYCYVSSGPVYPGKYPSKVDGMLKVLSNDFPKPFDINKLVIKRDKVSFGDVMIQYKYWQLVKDGVISVRCGWDASREMALVVGEHINGSFCIAGLK